MLLLHLVHALILILQHLVEFLFLLVAGQRRADLGNGVLADCMDLLDFVLPLDAIPAALTALVTRGTVK